MMVWPCCVLFIQQRPFGFAVQLAWFFTLSTCGHAVFLGPPCPFWGRRCLVQTWRGWCELHLGVWLSLAGALRLRLLDGWTCCLLEQLPLFCGFTGLFVQWWFRSFSFGSQCPPSLPWSTSSLQAGIPACPFLGLQLSDWRSSSPRSRGACMETWGVQSIRFDE